MERHSATLSPTPYERFLLNVRALITLPTFLSILTSFAIGAPTIAEEAKKMTENVSKIAHQLADSYAAELLKKHGDGKVTDAHIEELIKEKGISADTEAAKLIPKYVAARNTIATGNLAKPGTKAFNDLMEKLAGAPAEQSAAAPAAPNILPVNPFDLPSTRYENARTVAKMKSDLIAKQRLGTALSEVEAKEAAQETPFVASFSTHAIGGMRLLSPYISSDR